ncbi:MAG TPA: hypothetical protein VF103_15875, partial [Polyangiaceae bacterium]
MGGTGVGGSGLGGGGKGGSGVGGTGKGGSATGGSATGGSATGGSPMGGTGGTGVPVICSGANTCGSLPNGGLGLVAVVFPAAPIIDCSKNCIGFLADIVPHTEGDVDGNLDVATGDICVSGRIGMDSLLDIQLRPTTWDAAAHATTGFEFSIEGSDVPGAMEFGYGYIRDSENPRCAVLTPASGHHAVRLDSVRLECSTGVD